MYILRELILSMAFWSIYSSINCFSSSRKSNDQHLLILQYRLYYYNNNAYSLKHIIYYIFFCSCNSLMDIWDHIFHLLSIPCGINKVCMSFTPVHFLRFLNQENGFLPIPLRSFIFSPFNNCKFSSIFMKWSRYAVFLFLMVFNNSLSFVDAGQHF